MLKNHVLRLCPPCDRPEEEVILEGGALLWSVKWSKQDEFRLITQRHLSKCHSLKVSTVVFDGYAPSTKEGTRRSRYSVSSKVIDVSPVK